MKDNNQHEEEGRRITTGIDIKHINIYIICPSRLDIEMERYIYRYISILRLEIQSELYIFK